MATSSVTGAEDNAIPLDISAQLTDTDGSETLSVTISGIPEGSTLSAGTDNGDGSWTISAQDLADNPDLFDNLTITPPSDYYGDFTLAVSATSTETDSGDNATVTSTFGVTVTPVVDNPILDTNDINGVEDTTISLDIMATMDPATKETVETLVLDGIPENAVLSSVNGIISRNADGTFSISSGEISGLVMTPPLNYEGSFTIQVTALSTDGGVDVDTFNVDIVGALDVENAKGNEDEAISLNIDPGDASTVIIDGVPDGATLIGASLNDDGTYTVTDFENLAIIPPQNSDVDFTLTVRADDEEVLLLVEVDANADAPTLDLSSTATGSEDGTTDLDIASALTDTDGSETLSVTISNIPDGAVLTDASGNPITVTDGSAELTPDQLAGLQITPPEDFSGSFDLTVTATSTEENGGDTASTTGTITVDVAAVADGATITLDDASGFEDTVIPLSIDVSAHDASESLSVTISGVPDGAVLSAGTNNGDGTWTLSAGDLDGLTLTPPENSDVDFALDVAVTTTDGDSTATTHETLNVAVEAVADDPLLSAEDASGAEDTAISLDIEAALTDLDGSETLTVTLSNIPNGSVLTNVDGWQYTIEEGAVEVDVEDLPGLTITPPADFAGSFELVVTATSTEAENQDTAGVTEAATITVNVDNTNDGPVANDDMATTDEDSSVTINVLGNDTDADGDTLSVTSATLPGDVDGTVVINPDGTISFTPGDGFDALGVGESQDVEITYTISDGQGGTSSATATVTVTGSNDGPVANADSLSGTEDQPITFSAADLLGNDTDVDGDTLSITSFEQPDGGTIVDNNDGTFTFTPNENFNGDTTFTYTISDGEGGTSTASVAITVDGVADQADLEVTDATGNEDSAIALDIDLSSVDDISSITITGVPDGAELSAGTDNGDGTWTLGEGDLDGLTVTPPADSNEDFSLGIEVTTVDGDDTATVTGSIDVDVVGVADAPTLTAELGTPSVEITEATTPAPTTVFSSNFGNTTPGFVDSADGWSTDSDKIELWNTDSSSSGNEGNTGDGTYVELNDDANDIYDDATSINRDFPTEEGATYTLTFNYSPRPGYDADVNEMEIRIDGETIESISADGSGNSDNEWQSYTITFVGTGAPMNLEFLSTGDAMEGGRGMRLDDIEMTEQLPDIPGETTVTYPLDISSSLNDVDGSESLSITVDSLPDGAVLSAGTQNADGSWTLSADDLDGLTVTVTGDDAGEPFDFSVSATSTENDGDTATVSTTISAGGANVDLEADGVTVDVADASGNEDTAIALDIDVSQIDTDGSESLSITISGVPEGAELSAGTDNGNGTWTLTKDDLDDLTITPPENSNEDFQLTVTTTTTEETTGDTSTSTSTIDVDVVGVADAPDLDAGDSTAEPIQQTIDLNLSADVETAIAEGGSEPYELPGGSGLSGAVYNTSSSLSNLSGVDNLINNSQPTANFTSTDVNYSGGSSIGGFLGDDAQSADASLSASAETFAVQLTGFVYLEPGTHTFSTTSDDGFRLEVGGGTVTEFDGNRGSAESSGTFTVSEPGLYPIKVTYWENGGDQVLNVKLDGQTLSGDDLYSSPPDGVVLQADGHYSIPDEIGGGEVTVTVSGVPDGATLNVGTDNGDGTWTVSAEDAGNLQVTLAEGDGGPHDITLTVTDEDGDVLATQNVEAGDGFGFTADLDVSAALTDIDGSESLSVTIDGLPDGAVLSSGTQNEDGSWTVDAGDLDGLSVKLPSDAVGFDVTVTATSTENDGDTSTVTTTFSVDVPDHIADGATIDVADAAGNEDTAIALNIDVTQIDTDGSETMTITISGVPSGAELSAGTNNGDGTWTLEQGDLQNLSITPADDSNQDFQLTVTTTTTEESSGDTSTSTATIDVDVTGVADTPSLTASLGEGVATGGITGVDVSQSTIDAAGTDGATVTVSGVPDGASLSGGTDNGDGTWTLNADDLESLTITPADGAEGSDVSLTFEVTGPGGAGDNLVTENFTSNVAGWSGESGCVNGKMAVDYNDNASKTFDFGADHAGQTVTISFDHASFGGWDSSGSARDYLNVSANGQSEIRSSNTSGSHSFEVTLDANGRVTVAFDVDVTASDEGMYIDNFKIDTGDDWDTTLATETVDVELEPSMIAFDLNIDSALNDTDGSETLSITLDNLPEGAELFVGDQSITITNGSATLTADQLSGVSIKVPEGTGDFDLDVTATSTEDDGDTASQSTTLAFEMDNIDTAADGATITESDASGLEDSAIALDIDIDMADNDGSETLSITISGVPEGAALSAGTDNGDGTWTLGQDDLDGLTITPPADSSDNFDLTITATTTETSTGDTESSTATLTVDVTGVADAPQLSVDLGEPTASGGGTTPVAYWNMDETSGLTLHDQVGDHDGHSTGKSSSKADLDLDDSSDFHSGSGAGQHADVTTELNTGAEFKDGDRQYITVDHSAALKPASGSLTLWFNTDDDCNGTLASSDSSGYDQGGHFDLSINSNGQLELRMQDTNSSHTIAGGDVDSGEWNQVTVTWGEGGMKIYQNGELVASDPSYTGGLQGNENPWTFGASQMYSGDNAADNMSDYFDGHMDDIAIYDQPLTDEQIQDLYENGVEDLMESSGDEILTYPVDISANLADTDGSETLSITLTDLPDGVEFSAGTDNGDGTWTLDAGDIDSLQMTVPSGTASFDLNVTATATESDGDTRSVSVTATVEAPFSPIIEDTGNYDYEGTSGNDTMRGYSGDDVMQGGDGNDTMYGDDSWYQNSDGNDTMFGGDGNDTMVGGGGDDQIDGGAGNDVVIGDQTYQGSQVGDDTLVGGAGDDAMLGGGGSDTIYGGDGSGSVDGSDNDIIYGDSYDANNQRDYYDSSTDGGDTIYAEGGDDTVYGGGGDDTVFGGDGNDFLSGGITNDYNSGNGGDDYLDGGAGDDTLVGGWGDDTLVGGAGDDVASGGDGNDLFIFGSGDGSDHFSGGNGWSDSIQLDGIDSGPGGDSGWTLQLDSGGYTETEDGLVFDSESSGRIELADGSELTFDGVEKLEW